MARRAPDVQVAALEVFADVLSQGDSGASDDAFYSRLCEAVCRLAGMDRAILFRYDSALRRVRAAGTHGVSVELFAGERFSVESAPMAGRSLVEDSVIEVRGELHHELPARYLALLDPAPTHVVCTPMAAAGRWVGVILSDRATDAAPLQDDRELLWTLGKTAALAAVARIATSQRERAAQLEQRIDLAREVHDGVIQRLFGVSLALAGGELSDEARQRCAEEVQGALAELRATLQRSLGRAPRPSSTTLMEEVARLGREHPDLGVVLEAGDGIVVPGRLEPLVQSVLSEAVRNAHKHATPSRVAVRLRRAGGAFVMEVVNDGILQRRSAGTGMGLRLVAFEALNSGGVVEYGSGEGDVWRVKLVVPDDGD
jgi:signal transduction histidine kinase